MFLWEFVARLWAELQSGLLQYPLPTQCVVSALLWGLGDIIAQRFEGLPWQARRTLYTSLYGAAFIGPFGSAWYPFLDAVVGHYCQHGTLLFTVSKVCIDMAVFGCLHILAFFTYMTLVEGGSWKAVRQKIASDFVPTYAAALVFWPAYMSCVFTFAPVADQLLLVNIGCILDSSFMYDPVHM